MRPARAPGWTGRAAGPYFEKGRSSRGSLDLLVDRRSGGVAEIAGAVGTRPLVRSLRIAIFDEVDFGDRSQRTDRLLELMILERTPASTPGSIDWNSMKSPG